MRLAAAFLCMITGVLAAAGAYIIKKEPFMKNATDRHGKIDRIISDGELIKYIIRCRDDEGNEIVVPSCEYEKTEKYKEGDEVAVRMAVFRFPGKPLAAVRLKSQAVKKADRTGTLLKASAFFIVAGILLLALALTA